MTTIRSWILLLMICGAVLSLGGCGGGDSGHGGGGGGGGGSEAERAVKDVTAGFNQLADRLEKVTSKEQFAEADLKKIGDRLKSATEKMKVLETLPQEENERIGQTLGADMAKARARVAEQAERIESTIDPLAGERIAQVMGFDK